MADSKISVNVCLGLDSNRTSLIRRAIMYHVLVFFSV